VTSGALIGIGEVMIELAPVADRVYAQGFAGDTLNTCWYLRRLSPVERRVGYLTRVGADPLSDRLLDFLTMSGLDARAVSRDPERTLGLYLISLDGAERRFSYWRDQSAARRLADDPARLDEALADAALIHVSGITLAIVGAPGRIHLLAALRRARARGARVSFDPNVRRRLWPDEATLRDALVEISGCCDIMLPSFDDEASVWGDADPRASALRIASLGVGEIVVKNGAGPARVLADGVGVEVPARAVRDARDTTGAGDSFNAGYLAGRLAGLSATEACEFAHGLAAEVVRHPGALAPAAAIEPLRRELAERTGRGEVRADLR
jgi:2-dehydro-3-deoxygluconokinase